MALQSVEKEVRLVTEEHDDNDKRANESFEEMEYRDTFEADDTTLAANDKFGITAMQVRESIFNRNNKVNQFNDIQKEASGDEEICIEETKGKTSDQEDIVSK